MKCVSKKEKKNPTTTVEFFIASNRVAFIFFSPMACNREALRTHAEVRESVSAHLRPREPGLFLCPALTVLVRGEKKKRRKGERKNLTVGMETALAVGGGRWGRGARGGRVNEKGQQM